MKTRTIDPELLRTFVAVADRLSFTRAAQHLNRTQTAVSVQIKRLEAHLGATLFHRSTARVQLTAVGADFLPDARRILNLNEEAIARIANQEPVGRFRIGIMEDYGARLMPDILTELVEHFPRVQIDMEIGLTTLLLRQLDQAFDVVIAMHPEYTMDGSLICAEAGVWVGAPGSTIEEADTLPLALSNPDCLFRSWAVAALDAAGRPWRLAYVTSSHAALEAIVERGLAVSVVKRSMVSPRLRILPPGRSVPQLPNAEVRMHRSRALGSSATKVADELERLLRARALVGRTDALGLAARIASE